MKLGCAYNIFDGEEMLPHSLKNLRPMVDYICVVYQITSNFGNKNETLTTLSLNSNRIENTFGLSRMLKNNYTLENLYIGSNQISDDIKEGYYGAQAIATALQTNKNSALKILNISNNEIGDAGAIAFANMLKVNKTLTDLYISSPTTIGNDGVQAIVDALKTHNNTLVLFAFESSNTISKEILIELNKLIERNRKTFKNNAPVII